MPKGIPKNGKQTSDKRFLRLLWVEQTKVWIFQIPF